MKLAYRRNKQKGIENGSKETEDTVKECEGERKLRTTKKNEQTKTNKMF